jgi:hypothetical protein
MVRVAKKTCLLIVGLSVLSLVACGAPDKKVLVTVKGQGLNIDKYASLVFPPNNKPNSEAFAASTWTGAIAYADVAPTEKSPPAGPDGKFTFTFKAEPGSKFHLRVEGGTNQIPQAWPTEYTVPTGANPTVDVGVIPDCQKTGDIQELTAKAQGISIDAHVAQGTVMLITMAKAPAWTQAGGFALSPTEITVDNGFSAYAYTDTGLVKDVGGKANSPYGLYTITKKANAADTTVKVTMLDKGTGAGRPYTYADATIAVKPGFVVESLIIPK